MIEVSQAYKDAMDKPIRNRAYISVGVGVINQEAQKEAAISGVFADWSKGDVFKPKTNQVEYATLEKNYMKADGSMYFIPEDETVDVLRDNGMVSQNTMGSFSIMMPKSYMIKGITIDFGSACPTRFKISTLDKVFEYTNDSSVFTTEDVFGDVSYFTITPIEMLGGDKRLRIKSILMGVGLQYTNEDTKSFSMREIVSPISDELSSYYVSYSFFDIDDNFDVDDENSFIDYLDTQQKVTVSFGIELDDGSIDWNQIATTYLKDWQNRSGIVSLTAYDRMYHLEDTYSAGNKIYKRTAYEEAVSILKDAGLEDDEYYVDDYLKEFELINPMPEASHKECLQIVANACRCKIRQNEYGVTMIVPNFALLIDRDEISISDNGGTGWSNSENVLTGADVVYAELTPNFFKSDGSMVFMPEDGSYKRTGFVSESMSDENGYFANNPKLTIDIDYEASYYGLVLEFGGNLPKEFIATTYLDGTKVDSFTVDEMRSVTTINADFRGFNRLVIEFTKGSPNSRIIVNKVSFGALSDYVMKKDNMYSKPFGYKEKRIKDLRVKIYSFFENEEKEPEEIEDDVYYDYHINNVGETKIVTNPLIATEEHAALIAEWLGNHYANNVTYDVDFRGDPRINATDIIRLESDKIENLQVEVTSSELTFNGAFRGELGLRRAYNTTKGAI